VRNVQEETANAVQVIERGKKSVTEGSSFPDARAALSKILESARRSTHMAQRSRAPPRSRERAPR